MPRLSNSGKVRASTGRKRSGSSLAAVSSRLVARSANETHSTSATVCSTRITTSWAPSSSMSTSVARPRPTSTTVLITGPWDRATIWSSTPVAVRLTSTRSTLTVNQSTTLAAMNAPAMYSAARMGGTWEQNQPEVCSSQLCGAAHHSMARA